MTQAAQKTSLGLALLRQDVSHAARVKQYKATIDADQVRIARLEGILRLAVPVLRNGPPEERADVAAQAEALLAENKDKEAN